MILGHLLCEIAGQCEYASNFDTPLSDMITAAASLAVVPALQF